VRRCVWRHDAAATAAAVKVAENELLLSDIAAHKVWVVERLREPYAKPFASKDTSMELATARLLAAWLMEREIDARQPAMLEKYELRLLLEELREPILAAAASLEANESLRICFPQRAERVAFIRNQLKLMVASERERLMARGWRMESDGIVPIRLMALMDEREESNAVGPSDGANTAAGHGAEERDEYEALEAAARDLLRLERYERRTWSRQKRAILALANIRLERRLQTSPAPA
jgi:hypothetical protein